MKLNEIMDDLRPAAEAMARRGLTLKQAYRAFLLVYVAEAVQQGGNQKNAAKLIQVSEGYISRIVNDRKKLTKPPVLVPPDPMRIVGELEI